MSKQLCGNDSFVNIILGTTKWDKLTLEAGEERQRELVHGYWKEMVQHGSTIMRVQGGDSSIWKIIEYILDNVDYNVVQDETPPQEKPFLEQAIDTPSGLVHSLPLQRSTPGTRRKLPSELAEKCLDLMTVEDPNEDDIVIP